jgi:hypothetical protein
MKHAQSANLDGRRSNRLWLACIATGMGAASLLSLTPALPVGARTPSVATGQFSFTSDIQVPSSLAGPNIVIAEVATLTYSGALSGVATDTDTFVAHADGSFEGHGTEVCDPCSLWGHTGSFTSTFTFTGSGDGYIGHNTVVNSAGGLAGLHGGGTYQGLVAENINSYSYKLDLG